MTNLFPRFVPFWVFSRRYTVHDWLKIKVKQTCESLSFLSVAKSRRMSLNDDYSSCYRDYTYGKSQQSGRNWRLGNLPELPNHYSDRRFYSFLFYISELCSMHAMQFQEILMIECYFGVDPIDTGYLIVSDTLLSPKQQFNLFSIPIMKTRSNKHYNYIFGSPRDERRNSVICANYQYLIT